MEFDGQSEIPESGIKEAVMSTADHGSDHRTVKQKPESQAATGHLL